MYHTRSSLYGVVIATEKKRAILGLKFISGKIHETSQKRSFVSVFGAVRMETVQI